MSKEEDVAQQIVPLSCDTIVYRALKKQWVIEDIGSILFDAFMLRISPSTNKVEEGVSLTLTVEKCSKVFKNSNHVASLSIVQIQDAVKTEGLNISVVLTKSDHAEIRGLPCPIRELKKLQRVAGLLAKQCQLIEIQRQ
jgi:hypothetical protein